MYPLYQNIDLGSIEVCLSASKAEGETKERQRFPDLTRTTCANDSISRVSRMTRAVE